MPKYKGPIWQYFKQRLVNEKDYFVCIFCGQKYVKNATRMQEHLTRCQKCPKNVKQKFCKKYSAGQAGQGTSTQMDAESESECSLASVSTSTTSSFHRLDQFIDRTNSDEKKRFDEKLARAIYSSGSPIQMVENMYWKEFFKTIKPSYTLPSRHELSHKLLDAEYESLQGDVIAKIRTAETVSVQCDGWSNIRNEAVLNFVVTTPKPVLLKTMTTGAQSHTGEYIAQEIRQCITEIGPEKIMAIVSDNAAVMEKAKQIIATEFNYITTYSCIAHSLNLLVGDIMKLNSFKNVESSCKEIIKEINGSHKNLACFNKIQLDKYQKVRSLKLPVKTRWGSILYCVESLIITKEALQILTVSQESEGIKFSKNVRDHILDNDIFWVRLEKLQGILKPIVKWITILEGDTARISHVFIALTEIEGYINDNIKLLPIKSNEEKELISLFTKRKDHILKPIHLAAYLLDPGFNQSEFELNNVQHITAMQFIDNLISKHPHFQGHKETIILELTNYLGRDDIWSVNFVWESAKKSDCITWWKGICNKTKLKNVAIAILGLPASTAATERSFSTYSFIHCKKRNRLTTERAGKLLYIAHNLKLLNQNTPVSSCLTKDITEEGIIELDKTTINDSPDGNNTSCSLRSEKSREKQIMRRQRYTEGNESSSASDMAEEYSLHDSNSSIGEEDFSDLESQDNI